MKTKKLNPYFLTLLLILPIFVHAQELEQQLQAALESAVASPDTSFPGAILYLSHPEQGTWIGAAGVADIESNALLSPEANFRAGSILKPFVAVTVLQLIEEGKLSLETPMTEVLPDEYKALFPNAEEITVRMLLNHSSGLPEWDTPSVKEQIGANPSKVWKVSEFLELAAAQPPYFAPGQGYHYSNTDYNLLGLIIENITGLSWRDAVMKRVIVPLGLQHTQLPAPGDSSLPEGFMHGYEMVDGHVVDLSLVDPSMADAAGGGALVTTVADLARFWAALRAGELFQKEETLSEMMTFIEATDEGGLVGYGLGVEKYLLPGGLELIGHLGSTAGYRAFTGYFPSLDLSLAMVINTPSDPTPVILAALDIINPSTNQPDAGTALQGLLDDQVQQQGILGMVMAVRLVDGTVVGKSSGYLDPEGKTTWTPDTVSALGSVTKTFTAVVIMQLVQEGKLSLDDTINIWVPDQPNADKITVRMLLSHTSGLANFISKENERDPKWSHEWTPLELVAEANKLGPVDEPGTKVAHYANTNYFLLGLIIEAITGNSWEEEIRSRIIEPLGLEHTTFLGEEGIWGGILVPGYTKTADGYTSILDIPNLPHATTAWAAGAVVSSLSDLMTFASALFDGKLVSKETLSLMATPLGKDAESGRLWGLGGATLEEMPSAFGMGGDVPGYHAFFVGVQNTKLVVAALVNTEEGDVVSPGLMALEYLNTVSQTEPSTLAAEMDTYLKAQGDVNGFMGSVLVAKGDEVLFEQGYGMANLELNVPNTPQTVFRVGSITKQFTAALILKLQEEEKLNVNDALSKYLPDYPRASDITLQQLLNHTAGIYDYAESNPDLPKLAREQLSLDELIATFKDEPLTFEPGTKWSYSNSGYVLLTKVIEIASGMPYAAYLEQALLKPLGLNNTGVEDARAITPNHAAGYEWTPEGHLNAQFIDPSIPTGAGALVSTVHDLYTWDRALMTGKFLSEDSRQAMFAKTVNTEQPGMTTYYSDGWMMGERFGQEVIDHGGGIFGFSALNAFYPKDEVVVVVLTNVETAPSSQIAIDLAAIAFGQPYVVPTKNVAIQLNESILQSYVGSYQLGPDFSLTITLEDGHLYAKPPGEDKLEILPKSDTDFFLAAANVELTFTKNTDGVVDGLVMHQNGQDIPGKRTTSQ